MKPITRLFDFAYYQLETHNLEDALITKKDEQLVFNMRYFDDIKYKDMSS